ncbi:MAG: GNAT family N-acetyltransferase [Candidatus Pacearchaeota archaeon]
MDVVLRNYRKADYAQLKSNLETAKMYFEDMDSELLVNRMSKKDPDSIVIAEDNGKLIGSTYFIDLGFSAMLWRLNVLPEYRKKDIGKKLIEEVRKRAKSRGFTQIHFVVHEEYSSLINWYSKLGAWKGNLYRWMGFDL